MELGGNEIPRTEWLREGGIPSHTLRADIDYAESEALQHMVLLVSVDL